MWWVRAAPGSGQGWAAPSHTNLVFTSVSTHHHIAPTVGPADSPGLHLSAVPALAAAVPVPAAAVADAVCHGGCVGVVTRNGVDGGDDDDGSGGEESALLDKMQAHV